MKIQLVVARYRENLNWVRNIPPQIEAIIYDKSSEDLLGGSISLPNVGREAHTYLHHIVANYDGLPDFTVFAQGKPFDHAFDFHKVLKAIVAQETAPDFRWLGHIIDTDSSNGSRLFSTWSKNTGDERLDMNGFHRALLGTDGPEEYTFVLGAQFIAARELIRARSLEFWQNALEISIHFPDAAHCYERSWDKVFGVRGIDLAWLAGRKTVYLKPIKEKS